MGNFVNHYVAVYYPRHPIERVCHHHDSAGAVDRVYGGRGNCDLR